MNLLAKRVPIVISALLLAGHVVAQPAAAKPGAPASPAIVRPLTAEDARVTAKKLRNQIRAATQHVSHLQTRARKDKDVIKLSCVNDRLINLKAQANVFDLTERDLLGAIDDAAARQTNHARLVETATAVRLLREEADACIGQPEMDVDRGNDFTQPTLSDDPTTDLPFDITVESPAYASPYT